MLLITAIGWSRNNARYVKASNTVEMVQCDGCDRWVHYECVGVGDSVRDVMVWLCLICANINSNTRSIITISDSSDPEQWLSNRTNKAPKSSRWRVWHHRRISRSITLFIQPSWHADVSGSFSEGLIKLNKDNWEPKLSSHYTFFSSVHTLFFFLKLL